MIGHIGVLGLSSRTDVSAVISFEAQATVQATGCELGSDAVNETKRYESIQHIAVPRVKRLLALRPLSPDIEVAANDDHFAIPRIVQDRTQLRQRAMNRSVRKLIHQAVKSD